MAVNLSPAGGVAAQFFDNSGNPLSGGKIYTYAAGTTTNQATYTSSSGSTAHTNPIILDSAGRVPGGEIWLTDQVSYKFVIRTSTDVLIGTYDNIVGINNTVNAENVVYDPPFTGGVQTNVEAKLAQTISIKDFGALTTNSAAQNATALLAAEATGANDIYVPPGTYNVTGTTVLTKRYNGPGSLAFSGLGAQTFTGAGLNDATYTGTYNGNRPLQIVVKINSTGTPDTLAYSFNGGVTFLTTQAVYDPATDSYTVGPINIVAGPMEIFGTGIFVTFASTTGHTLNNSWAFTLTPNLQTVNTQGTTFSVQGAPFAAAFGVQNTQLGINSFGNLNSVGSGNTALGYNTLYANTIGFANTAVGALSLEKNTSGAYNQAFGNATLVNCTTGSENVALGVYSLYALTTGGANVGCGVDTNRYLVAANGNTAVGTQALYHNTAGFENAAVGLYALRGGSQSLSNGTSQSYCAAVGAYALYFGGGQFNAALGHTAGYNNIGEKNVFIGGGTGPSVGQISGGFNIFVGYGAGSNASQSLLGQNSIAIGDNSYTTGGNAVAIGSGVSSPANIFTVCNSLHTFFRPSTDNVTALGGPSNRWTVVYAATGAINTSDEREKQQIKPIDAAVLRAWAKVEYCQYKFNDAVEKKGDDARWHFGLVAQRVKDAFESEGLDAFEYGVLCHNTWEDGDRYGIRYEEALALECAYLRSQLSKG
jgi:hypothetical protein